MTNHFINGIGGVPNSLAGSSRQQTSPASVSVTRQAHTTNLPSRSGQSSVRTSSESTKRPWNAVLGESSAGQDTNDAASGQLVEVGAIDPLSVPTMPSATPPGRPMNFREIRYAQEQLRANSASQGLLQEAAAAAGLPSPLNYMNEHGQSNSLGRHIKRSEKMAQVADAAKTGAASLAARLSGGVLTRLATNAADSVNRRRYSPARHNVLQQAMDVMRRPENMPQLPSYGYAVSEEGRQMSVSTGPGAGDASSLARPPSYNSATNREGPPSNASLQVPEDVPESRPPSYTPASLRVSIPSPRLDDLLRRFAPQRDEPSA